MQIFMIKSEAHTSLLLYKTKWYLVLQNCNGSAPFKADGMPVLDMLLKASL